MFEPWHKVDPQTSEKVYVEWHTKHEFQSTVTLNIDHRGSLEIDVDGRYLSLRAEGLYVALKEYFGECHSSSSTVSLTAPGVIGLKHYWT